MAMTDLYQFRKEDEPYLVEDPHGYDGRALGKCEPLDLPGWIGSITGLVMLVGIMGSVVWLLT